MSMLEALKWNKIKCSRLEYVNEIVSEALCIEKENRLSRQISKFVLELASKQFNEQNINELSIERLAEELDSSIAVFIQPFKEERHIKENCKNDCELNCKKYNPSFAKIETMCKELEYGELVLKIQNGSPTMVESIKKQVKLKN